MKLAVKIIKYLLEQNTTDQNISLIASALEVDYKNVYEEIRHLVKDDILSLEKFGNSNKIALRKIISPLLFEAEYVRRKELEKKNKNFGYIMDYFHKDFKTKLYVTLLFGSYAKGTETKNSDIDLMFVVSDKSEEKIEREILRIASIIPLNIHITVVAEKNFLKMKESRQDTVVSEALKHNIILYGIECYYEMIK